MEEEMPFELELIGQLMVHTNERKKKMAIFFIGKLDTHPVGPEPMTSPST
jgi:hypothetical protein